MAVGTRKTDREAGVYLDAARHTLGRLLEADEEMQLTGGTHHPVSDLEWIRTVHEVERVVWWYTAGELGAEREEELLDLLRGIARALPAIHRMGLPGIKLPPGDELGTVAFANPKPFRYGRRE